MNTPNQPHQRLLTIRHQRQHLRRTRVQPTLPRLTQAYPKTQGSQVVMDEVRDLFLVTQRKTLEQQEPNALIRWLLRRYFQWRGYACRGHCGKCDGCYASVEYVGVFDDAGVARWVANGYGGAVKPIPFNAALPYETVAYQQTEVPLSEEAQWYRRGVVLPFVAVPRAQFEALGEQIDQLVESSNKSSVAVVAHQ